MKKLLLFVCFLYITVATSSVIDFLEATNGHEPRVAINCGKIPFYIDLETNTWIADSESTSLCDANKEDVKKYCQLKYKSLNITNVVESNAPVQINNWCDPGVSECKTAKKVVPYRCLVNEYEADALMVPDGCKFDHIHDETRCLSHDDWKIEAAKDCTFKHGDMVLKDYGILLSCKTDFFTGVEYVCCPKPHVKVPEKEEVNQEGFAAAIKKFQSYIPLETKGCDRSNYLTKEALMEDRHRNQIAAVIDEWDEAERRYNKLKAKDPVAAEEKMKRTLEVFRQTLAALEDESKEEKNRLRAEHAQCIDSQIALQKRTAMISYLAAIEAKPADAENILQSVRLFIQACEHDRVHSLRHFEHVRNRDEDKAEALRPKLLQHLKDLNKVVNESMSLLNYLPEVAEKFGLGHGAILKPKIETPSEEHVHGRIDEILKSASEGKFDEKKETEIPNEPKPIKTGTTPLEKDIAEAEKVINSDYDFDNNDDLTKEDEERERVLKMLSGSVSKSKTMVYADDDVDEEANRVQQEIEKNDHEKRSGSRSVYLTAVLGLSCGVVVVMLFVVIAMIMRRKHGLKTRVVISENNDREHLVEMQKNGFENPTYKFFYF